MSRVIEAPFDTGAGGVAVGGSARLLRREKRGEERREKGSGLAEGAAHEAGAHTDAYVQAWTHTGTSHTRWSAHRCT